MPRELIRDPAHDRQRSLGWLALAWIEHFLVHGPGDVQGRSLDPDSVDALPLDDELAAFVVDVYALDPTGRRLYDSVFLSRPKGRDKSGHAARLVLWEALGPCRFAGWAAGGEVYTDPWGLGFEYAYQAGEPMGRPVTYPFIRCLATEEGQAGNTYDNVHYNLVEGPLAQVPGVDPGLTRTILPDRGEIVPSTAANASKDGGKESFVVFDETHLYTLPELHGMYATVRRNADKRRAAEPWVLETSTMYAQGEDSVAERTHTFARSIREGKTKAGRLLFDHREAPADVDLADEGSLRAGLMEAYGPFSEVMDLDRIINSIWDSRNSPSDSRRYFLNRADSASDAWLAEHEWAAIADPTKVVADGELITIGGDGSRRRSRGVTDATALIGCRVEDGHLFEIGVWEQPDGPAGRDWQIPVTEVDAAVAMAMQRWTVVGFYFDPAKWETQVSAWEGRYGSQMRVRSTRDHPMHWWMTGGRATLAVRATEELHTAVVDQAVTHSGEYALTRHMLNARRRVSKVGVQVHKEFPDSPRKIDAAIAAILAYKARTDALAAGVTTGPRRRSRALHRF